LTDDTNDDILSVMGDVKEIGAAELRQSLGRIAKRLERDGQPIILKVGRKRVGAIVSIRDFEERFALHEAAGRRAELVEQILSDRRKVSRDADAVLLELREPRSSCSTLRSPYDGSSLSPEATTLQPGSGC
jgi:hypothetical protein